MEYLVVGEATFYYVRNIRTGNYEMINEFIIKFTYTEIYEHHTNNKQLQKMFYQLYSLFQFLRFRDCYILEIILHFHGFKSRDHGSSKHSRNVGLLEKANIHHLYQIVLFPKYYLLSYLLHIFNKHS